MDVQCQMCGVFKSAANMSKHVSRDHGTESKCGICKVIFKSKALLKEHEGRVHTDAIACENCSKGGKVEQAGEHLHKLFNDFDITFRSIINKPLKSFMKIEKLEVNQCTDKICYPKLKNK